MTVALPKPSELLPAHRDRTPFVLALRGWVCDRYTDRGMAGSALIAQRVAARLGLSVADIGTPEPAADLGWRESLARATPYLCEVAALVEARLAAGGLPLLFANRCGASLATIAAALRVRPDMRVVWCDAHGDFNTPASTPTGYLGGMVLTALCGLWDSGLGAGLTPDRIVLVAQRDFDAAELALIRAHRVTHIPATNGHVDEAALLAAAGGAPIWLHIDADVVDPAYLPAEYKVAGGLHPEAVARFSAALLRGHELVGFELTEFEPPLDDPGAALDTILDMIAPVLEACRP